MDPLETDVRNFPSFEEVAVRMIYNELRFFNDSMLL